MYVALILNPSLPFFLAGGSGFPGKLKGTAVFVTFPERQIYSCCQF